MKIKHVAILLIIPLALLGLWSSSRLYIAYSATGAIIDQLPITFSNNLPTSSIPRSSAYPPPIAIDRTLKPITTASSAPKPEALAMEPPEEKTVAASTMPPITTTTTSAPKQETITAAAAQSQKPPPIANNNKKPLFDISQEAFGESFSACLKWMDDYRQLGEWLAYHYHVLPLRYLVFFRDPKSTMDPQPIFDKWSDKIQIQYWTNNSDFMTHDQQKTIDKMTIDTKKHRRAQRFFYHACLQHLHKMNRTWSILIDTDEYLILDSKVIPNVPQLLQEPGAALRVIRKAQAKDPSIVTKETPQKWFENCTVMTRKEYPAFESPREKVFAKVPNDIDAYRLVTLRFRHRGQKLIGKSMVDVSTLDMPKIRWRDVYSHNLFLSCSHGNNKGDLMYVGHYLGSLESYQRPADRRNDWMNRTKRFLKLNAKSQTAGIGIGKGDDEVRPWIQGFAANVGLEEMHYLLQDVGFPYNATTALQVLD